MASGDAYEWLRDADDAVLDQFAAELTETLPPDDPVIIEVRYWLRRMRDAARERGDGPGIEKELSQCPAATHGDTSSCIQEDVRVH